MKSLRAMPRNKAASLRWLGAALCLVAHNAQATGNAYFVDDGNIVAPGKVQSESWLRISDHGKPVEVVNGAYQVWPNLELQMQFNKAEDTQVLNPQAKYAFYVPKGGPWAISIAAGLDEDTVHGLQDVYLYVPATFTTLGKALELSANLGVVGRMHAPDGMFWGAGGEYHFNEHASLVSEYFGYDTGRAGWQAGPRWEPSPRVQWDFVYGHDIAGTPSDTATVGVTLLF